MKESAGIDGVGGSDGQSPDKEQQQKPRSPSLLSGSRGHLVEPDVGQLMHDVQSASDGFAGAVPKPVQQVLLFAELTLHIPCTIL